MACLSDGDANGRCHWGFGPFGERDLPSDAPSQHVNGIESFWSFAKRRLIKFNGIPRHTFYLHLNETEFRFNHRQRDSRSDPTP